jgi:hypothetical protein
MDTPAFFLRHQSDYENISTVSFYINSSYEVPRSLMTSNISQFQSALTFAAKLIEMEKSIKDDFTRDALFAGYLKDIEARHYKDLTQVEKKAVSESASMITPLVQKITDMEKSAAELLDGTRREYDLQIKNLQKTNRALELELTSSRIELESSFQKDIRHLQRRIAELEIDLAKSSKSDSIIREQCQGESDRLIKEIRESSRELIKAKEDSLQQRESALIAKEEEFQIKLQRSSSSVYRGQDGEEYFSKLVKDRMNWDLIYTGDTPHSCDYSSTIQGNSIFFELKNYTYTISQKEVTKFLRDMKEHPEVTVGVFISLNTSITGKPKNTPISIDWIHGKQCVLYIQSCIELDIDLVLSTIDQVIRISGIFSRAIKSQEEGTGDEHYQMRIDNAKQYVHNSLLRTASLIRKIQADKKTHLQFIETSTTNSIVELKQQSAELETAMQILLNEYKDTQADETEHPEIMTPLVKEKPKRKEKKAASK